MSARICRWYDGKTAALSFRFDDSHPTHIEKAAPMLNEFNLVGTFLINPGREGFQQHRETWENDIVRQGHELGDHTMLHRGATSDSDAEEQIGRCAEHIWRVQPDKSKLLAFQRGGATVWLQRKPFEYFLARYHLFEPGRSMSCSEAYKQFSLNAYKKSLRQAIRSGEWMETHFHGIDATHLHISTATFRDILAHSYSRGADLWQAGMAAIHKYQEARDASHLIVQVAGPNEIRLHLTCVADPELFDQPLTLEVDLPPRVRTIKVSDKENSPLEVRIARQKGARVARFDIPVTDGVYAVRVTGIGTQYLEANGPELPAPGQHPYLFFRREDLPALVAKTRQPVTQEMWDQVREEADRLVEAGSHTPDAPPSFEDARTCSGNLRLLGFAYAITGDACYVRRAWADAEVALEASSWNHPKHKGDADLVSAEICCSLAIGYDWMHEALSPDQRDRIRDAIVTRGLEPIMRDAGNDEWWSIWYRGNWGSVIFGQAGVAALALLDEEPRALDWVRQCRRKNWGYGQALGEDGSWGESVSYGCYAWSNATLLMDALHHVSGGAVDHFDNPRIRELPRWFIHMLVPDESGFIPFANCGVGRHFRGQYLYRLAAQYQDGQAQWIADKMTPRGGVFGLLWYDPDVAPQPPSSLPLSRHFDHTDWAVMRSRWDDPNAVLFGLKGGQKDWDHYHHDMNHFVLYAGGRPLVIDLNYPHEIWGCETEAHNTVKVNERDQRGIVRLQGCRGNPEHRGVLGDLIDAGWYARMVGDASLAYEQDDVNSYVREVIYLRKADDAAPPDYFLLYDDIDTRGAFPVDWHLHTYGSMSLQGNRVTITQDTAAVDVTILAPGDFQAGILHKTMEESGGPVPFEGAEGVTFLKLRPATASQHTRFLSVLVPRAADVGAPLEVNSISDGNTVGAQIDHVHSTDVVLFATDTPELVSSGIVATGRSCVVRRKGGEILSAALNNGQRLEVDGTLIFDTDGCGHVAMTVTGNALDAQMDIYGKTRLAIRTPSRPRRLIVDGKEATVEYDRATGLVELRDWRVRNVRIEWD
jgi:hypothetical protein